MSTPAKKGSILATISSSFSHFGSAAYSKVNSLLRHEDLEVVPEGGQGDVEDEAAKGRFKLEERESMWRMMHKYIGADITSMVTLPVMIFEPMTMLQKMAELMEYSYLLDMADQCEDPQMKMVYASTWALSVYYAYQRTWKPFNPILGETYEMVNHEGFMFLAEQVSHHPPMSSAHAESEHFSYDITSRVKTKFLGNSLDVYPVGRTRVVLKRSNMVLDLVPPPTKVHNLIVGRTWVDSPGDMIMTNLTTGDKAVLYFQPCGWFGRRFGRARKGGRRKARQPGQKVRYEVDGYVYNKNEEPKFIVSGNWNKSMSYQACDVEGEPIAGTDLKEIWSVAEVPKGDKFQYTHFAHKVNSFESAPAGLLPSDSRLRPDRYSLEMGDMNKAGSEKSKLEERQRTEKRFREVKKQEYSPRWFRNSGDIAPTLWGDLEIYEYNGKYTKHRQHQDSISSKPVDLEQLKSIPFNPWQYGQPEDQNIPHGSQVLPLASEPVLS